MAEVPQGVDKITARDLKAQDLLKAYLDSDPKNRTGLPPKEGMERIVVDLPKSALRLAALATEEGPRQVESFARNISLMADLGKHITGEEGIWGIKIKDYSLEEKQQFTPRDMAEKAVADFDAKRREYNLEAQRRLLIAVKLHPSEYNSDNIGGMYFITGKS